MLELTKMDRIDQRRKAEGEPTHMKNHGGGQFDEVVK
jgi:hypothetical protein